MCSYIFLPQRQCIDHFLVLPCILSLKDEKHYAFWPNIKATFLFPDNPSLLLVFLRCCSSKYTGVWREEPRCSLDPCNGKSIPPRSVSSFLLCRFAFSWINPFLVFKDVKKNRNIPNCWIQFWFIVLLNKGVKLWVGSLNEWGKKLIGVFTANMGNAF